MIGRIRRFPTLRRFRRRGDKSRPDIGQPTLAGAESLASSHPPLVVAAERVASTVAQGVHGRRRVGPGDAFWQHRPYLPGDNTRFIDWRQSARSQGLFVRQTEWEAAQTVYLWCDNSPSMAFASRPTLARKVDRGQLLLLVLAILLVRGGERAGLLGGATGPASGHGIIQHLADDLSLMMAGNVGTASAVEKEDGNKDRDRDRDTDRDGDKDKAGKPSGGNPGGSPPGGSPPGGSPPGGSPQCLSDLPQAIADLPPHAHLVLISDFLDPMTEFANMGRFLAAQRLRAHFLQILDPAEVDFPYRGRVEFTGPEGETPLLVGRAENLRDAYLQRFALHQRRLAELTHTLHAGLTLHVTDHSVENAVLETHNALGPLGFIGEAAGTEELEKAARRYTSAPGKETVAPGKETAAITVEDEAASDEKHTQAC